jgi:hypothetical protein
MYTPLERALETVEEAAAEIFEADASVRSVGVTHLHGDFGWGYRVVRNSAATEQFLFSPETHPVQEFHGIPVGFVDTPAEVEPLVAVTGIGEARPQAASVVPEVRRHRPLVAGLQIQNFDDDVRQGLAALGTLMVGSLGCFVRLPSGATALLSNNHVVAGENRGVKGADRILQPGSLVHDPDEQVGVLTDFVALLPSPVGASPKKGDAVLNELDVGVAQLDAGITFRSGYLPFRSLSAPVGTGSAANRDRVFKVGRTTGLTYGEVVDVATIVGPVPYAPGPCWFRRSLTIEGLHGSTFSDLGDSGSAIVRLDGSVVGILYSTNGRQSYACPIEDALQALGCTLL